MDLAEELTARMDGADLTEALGALIENAATHARGQVALSARRDTARILIFIRDDGPGMPADQIGRLRQRGQRLDTAGQDDGGTGLGLAIADEIITRADGHLEFDSTGDGLCVTLHLPAMPKA